MQIQNSISVFKKLITLFLANNYKKTAYGDIVFLLIPTQFDLMYFIALGPSI